MGPGETLLGLCIRYTVLRTEYIDGVQRMNQGPEVIPPRQEVHCHTAITKS